LTGNFPLLAPQTDLSKTIGRKLNNWKNPKTSRRARVDIAAEILTLCDKPKTKTKIMHRANLNHSQLHNYLEELTTRNLLAPSMNKYALTGKGTRFLKLYSELNNMLTNERFEELNSILTP
jgi:predicted transcriptional regulator